jgi:hypothetical protein
MSRTTIFISSFTLSLACCIFIFILRIMHNPQNNILVAIAIIAAVIYSAIALSEVWSSRQIKTSEKMMWTTGFIFLNIITASLYVLTGRKRVLQITRPYLNIRP